MNYLYLCLLLLAVVTLSSCQKDLTEQEIPYQGKWESANYTIFISSDGRGSCIQKKLGMRCNGAVTITDRKIVFTSNSLDAHLFRVKFRINQRPDVDMDGTAFMILNGEKFEK
jgi:hypothetical protein